MPGALQGRELATRAGSAEYFKTPGLPKVDRKIIPTVTRNFADRAPTLWAQETRDSSVRKRVEKCALREPAHRSPNFAESARALTTRFL